jgi:serine/threonine protein phosphatase PrpC
LDWNNSLQYVALTDIGMRRSNNQDSHVVVLASDFESWKNRGHFFMVADGMGAHNAGELASKLAVEGVSHLYRKYTDVSAPEALQKAMLETNSQVHQRGQANADFRNMGTTASTLIVLPQGAFVAHIGDSRIYRLRGSVLEQLTFDHSLVWELRAAGQLTEDAELSHSIPKNVITRSLGPNASVQADIEGPLSVQVGDTFLLCSDGLTGRISDEELAAIMSTFAPAEGGQMLIDLANLRGGQDNITLVIARVESPELATPEVGAEPIKIGARASQPVHPAIWATAVVCGLLALVLFLIHNPLPAFLAAIGGVLALLVGIISGHRNRTPGLALENGRRLGKGPYVQVSVPPIEMSLQKLANFTLDLRHSPAAANMKIDWTEFDRECQEAANQTQAAQHTEAMHSYARACRVLMKAIREAQNSQASDSSIEL